ncbi:MAG TPA: hypothetical protein VLM75_08835 [Spirochaetota bacterium]|nr:hypothetical protein [Spirochaetota bacterium]
MEAPSFIPAAEAISAPWWLFESLGIIALSVHFIFINIVVGGSLIAIGSRIAARFRGENTSPYIPHGITTALALGINFGVAPLLFTQVLYGHLLYTSSILMAAFWISIIPLLIVAYYGAYIHTGGDGRGALRSAALAFSTLALLYIAFIFVNNMTLMLQPQVWKAFFANRAGTILNLGDPTIIPRYLHFLIASVAVAGLFSALMARRAAGVAVGRDVRKGLRIFAFATFVQVFAGLWFLASLPEKAMLLFLGGDTIFTIILALGVVLAIASIVFALRGRVIPATAALVAIIFLMVVNRANLRSAYIREFSDPARLHLEPQYGVMTLFLVAVIGMTYALWRMIGMLPVSEEGRKGR